MIDFDKLRAMSRLRLWGELVKHPVKYGASPFMAAVLAVLVIASRGYGGHAYTPYGGSFWQGLYQYALHPENIKVQVSLSSVITTIVVSIAACIFTGVVFVRDITINNRLKAEWRARSANEKAV